MASELSHQLCNTVSIHNSMLCVSDGWYICSSQKLFLSNAKTTKQIFKEYQGVDKNPVLLCSPTSGQHLEKSKTRYLKPSIPVVCSGLPGPCITKQAGNIIDAGKPLWWRWLSTGPADCGFSNPAVSVFTWKRQSWHHRQHHHIESIWCEIIWSSDSRREMLLLLWQKVIFREVKIFAI